MEKKNKILFITTMYPDPLRPATKVCHYFTSEWAHMGYELIVINFRSIFPRVYTDIASVFPKLAHRYIGNHVEMDRNKRIIKHNVDGIPVYSIPIFKFIPHGKYPKRSISLAVQRIDTIIKDNLFHPDYIIGHFFNPTTEIIFELRNKYPLVKSCIVFHEWPNEMYRLYGEEARRILDSFDILGFRHKTMRNSWERRFGPFRQSFICYSGTASSFISTPCLKTNELRFRDSRLKHFVYVGQFTKNKCVKESIMALHKVYPDGNFCFTCIGDGGTSRPQIDDYILQEQLQNQVLFTGRLQREELIRYYDENECFIMISRSEAFGLVYLEAMARGCICVGTRGQGIDGVIIDGKNGFLCKGGDSDELQMVLSRINDLTYEERLEISLQARATAVRFSDSNVAKMYIDSVINS